MRRKSELLFSDPEIHRCFIVIALVRNTTTFSLIIFINKHYKQPTIQTHVYKRQVGIMTKAGAYMGNLGMQLGISCRTSCFRIKHRRTFTRYTRM